MKPKKIKIQFIIPILSAGGAERVLSFLSENLNTEKFECSLIVIGPKVNLAYSVSEMNVTYLNKKKVSYSLLPLFQLINTEQPNIVMGSIGHVNMLLGFISIFFPKIKFVGRQSNISKFNSTSQNKKNISLFLSFFSKRFLKYLDYMICQSKDMLLDCQDSFQIKSEKLKLLHNPITDDFIIKSRGSTKNNSTRFITVGRLTDIKGHRRILQLLSKLQKDFTYTLIGDGPNKEHLLHLASELGIREKITYIPFTSAVADYLKNSDYFLQGSYSEGFPNALLESCAVGTPVIAFDAPGGTREIVEPGINGFLAKDEVEFLHHLQNLSPIDPKQVSESVYRKFSKEIILKQYEAFFNEITA